MELDLRGMDADKGFKSIFRNLDVHGQTSKPRGQEIIELENLSLIVPDYVRFMEFPSRKYSFDYLRREFQWYVNGDPTDDRIVKYAKLWGDVRNPDGSWASNYGAYLFRDGQLLRAIQELQSDPDSRRAVVVILAAHHFVDGVKDLPCTYGFSLRIRSGVLNMSVRMRSQDAIFGLGNDLPIWQWVLDMTAALVGVPRGDLHLCVDSFHIYQRHYEMMYSIVGEDFEQSAVPALTLDDARHILFATGDKVTPFWTWLMRVSL